VDGVDEGYIGGPNERKQLCLITNLPRCCNWVRVTWYERHTSRPRRVYTGSFLLAKVSVVRGRRASSADRVKQPIGVPCWTGKVAACTS